MLSDLVAMNVMATVVERIRPKSWSLRIVMPIVLGEIVIGLAALQSPQLVQPRAN